MADEQIETDWEGRPVPADEPDDKIIRIWVVTPHPQARFDELWVRSWQQMLSIVTGELAGLLESQGADDLIEEGFKLKFELAEVRLPDYRDTVAGIHD